VGGFSLPFWGQQPDRHRSRKMVTIVAFLFGLACIYMGFVQNAMMIGLGFIFVRMLGQGSLGLISQTVINQWWVKKRGTIMGISGLLAALLGTGIFPSLVYWLISAFTWRWAYIILGVGLLVIMVPVGLIFFRNRPEDYGLYPDGESQKSAADDDTTIQDITGEESWTLKEAIHTVAFWVYGLGLTMFTMLITGITFHLVSIFQNQGLEPALAAGVFLPMAIAAAGANFLSGYLSDRIPLRYLLAAGLLFQAVSSMLTLWISTSASVLLFGIVVGIASGIPRALSSVVWPALYGRKHLGSIYGFASSLTIIGAALGPIPFGYAYDLTGSYQPVLWTAAIITFLFAAFSLLTPEPSKG